MVSIEKLDHEDGGIALQAHVAVPDGRDGKLPAVLVYHAFRGQSDFERERAERIAREMGLVGVALDVYGRGVLAQSVEEAQQRMRPFLRDRGALRRRLLAGLEAAARHPRVDPRRMAAIGFCFGGLCVLDLARAGAPLRGVCSFHGLFTPPQGLPVGPIRARVLVLHGYDDPMATPEQLLALAKELSAHGVDWQAHLYGGTMHAFTNPAANDPERGTVYQPDADRRSWIAMKAFLAEVLQLGSPAAGRSLPGDGVV